MNVLITGGTGFIGSRLALACLTRGCQVRVLGQENTDAESRNHRILADAGIRIIIGSVLDVPALSSSLAGVDLVFHLAAAQHEANVPDQKFWDVNVTGTRNLLSACVEKGVKRVIHGSTIGVYGASLSGEIDEESPTSPDNIYGKTKLEGEKLALSFCDRLPVVVIRISETYGPGDRRLLKLFRAIKKRMFFMIGSGENLHHLIYIDDLIEGFLAASVVPHAAGQVFLLAGPNAVSTNEMVSTIAAEVGGRIPGVKAPLGLLLGIAFVLEAILRPLGIQPPLHRRRMDFFKKSFSLSAKKAQSVLEFKPTVGFREGVAATARWYREMDELAHSTGQEDTMQGLGSAVIATDKPAAGVPATMLLTGEMTAKIEPFDSFWEGPENVEKGYKSFCQFYKHNYLKFLPADKLARILVISCGPGYFVNLLVEQGYSNVIGIDSDPMKIGHALKRNLPCRAERAVPHLMRSPDVYDTIFCEQELNHMTKEEMLAFLSICRTALKKDGVLIVHGLNGANPITGAEALAQNFDHYNTFTEYTLRQVLGHTGFAQIQIIPLNLYVFYTNPLNYLLILLDRLYSLFFTFSFMLYGKNNRVWTKKLGAACRKATA